MSVANSAHIEHARNALQAYSRVLAVCERTLAVADEFDAGKVEALRDYQRELAAAAGVKIYEGWEYADPYYICPQFPPSYHVELQGSLGRAARECRFGVDAAKTATLDLWKCTVFSCRRRPCDCLEKARTEVSLARRAIAKLAEKLE